MPAEAYILDGYVDEPACLGVPPYISPYIRTVAGVLVGHRFTVRYLTIDQSRKDPHFINKLDRANLMVMIAGVTVPGKYLGGTRCNPHRDPAGRPDDQGAEKTDRGANRVRLCTGRRPESDQTGYPWF